MSTFNPFDAIAATESNYTRPRSRFLKPYSLLS